MFRPAWFRAWITVLLCLVGPAAAMARGPLCPTGSIAVTARQAADRAHACQAITEALPFLRHVGLRFPSGVDIHVAGTLREASSGSQEFARFDGERCEIWVLEYRAARAAAAKLGEDGLNVAMGRALWRGYVIHELTHAAIHSSCERVCPDRAGHEYIAAVAQLSSLPESVRGEILRGHAGLEGFDRDGEISEIYYALSPSRFMVKAYLHYLRPDKGRAFIRSLLHSSAAKPDGD